MYLYMDRFVIVASDGLWDFLSDEEAVAVVEESIKRNDKVCCIMYLYTYTYIYL
jgi:serine/threonine protein phosphatase PrpC